MAKMKFNTQTEEGAKSEYESWVAGTHRKLIPLEELHEHPDNWELVGHIEKQKRDSLKEDIERSGIREDLQVWVQNGRLIVVSGHERLNIARELGLQELPCVKVDFKSELEARQHIYATNVHRKTVKRPADEVLVELFPPSEYPLLYADLRSNYSYTEDERTIVLSDGEKDEGNEIPSEKGRGERIDVLSDEEKRAARERRREERKEQERLRKHAGRVIGKSKEFTRKTINRVAARHREEQPAKNRPLSAREKKRGEKLALQLKTLRETRSVLEKKLQEVKKREKQVLKELKSVGQAELFGIG